ncbi:BTAD domain-containing putative transcriptional regulator [Actinacidiphila rubida]|uniref:BTAD domain-containing putative transcriptional regulator n=1 Tax=Actinacidiphila rubida TaxID=310780 RepID=UPI0009435FB0|nr:BTAD domain-containing putative transcriptional regulator [Actinacidiphila rubida]
MRRYGVLGVTEVWDGGVAVPLGGGKLRALLTVLVMHAGRAVGPERLIDEVWADEPPADASGALQALVARLRRSLGREAVVSEPGGYRLDAPPETVDLFEFEAALRDGERALKSGDAAGAAQTLDRALASWRGPVFADLPDRAAAAVRPEALRLTALRLRIEADLARGRATQALPVLREAVADHPLDEAFRTQLIRALRAEGRTADALVAFETARTVLADTLGADPGPELRALHAELLGTSGSRPQTEAAPGAAPPNRGNLRARLTSFVGREADLREIAADLSAGRLVTLTGPGGSGKTRLAQEAADRTAYPDGVWLAELAPLDDPAGVPHAVLSALGRREIQLPAAARDRLADAHGEDPLERLLEYCGQRRLLLVLDNCEHVIGAAADLTAELLAVCPGVTVLATSREPLGVPGEVVRPVEPLAPGPAYQLFGERAAAARAGAAGYDSAEDVAAVQEICRRLDGLPLAIELAAARLRALSPRQIADRLDDRFRLLTGGSRTLLPRQQTLRAVVDWSWDLLDEPERAALRGLSVFAGGCTLAAAEAVCGPDAVLTVAQLVDKSLVVAEHGRPGGTRYRLLETIHEYAAERLAAVPEEAAAAAARHGAHVRDLVVATEPKLRAADQLEWLEVLETELDNIRAALHRSVSAGDERGALTIALAMGWFWTLRNYRDEAGEWVDRVIALGERGTDPSDPLYWPRLDVRMLDFFVKSDRASEEQWHSAEAEEEAAALMAAYRVGGPPAARFPGMLWPFAVYLFGGAVEVRRHTEEMVANCREYGDDWSLAAALMFRTHAAVDSPGALDAADADLAELRRLCTGIGDRWMRAQLHGASAEIETLRCNYDLARADFEASMGLAEELGALSETPFLLGRMADLEHRAGHAEVARKLCARAEEMAERFAVWDARTYIRYLKALLLLEEGDTAGAAALAGLVEGHIADGTPPPSFQVLVTGLKARVAAADGDTAGALAGLAETVRRAVEVGCTDPVVAETVDVAAQVLRRAGDLVGAVRLASAADAVRGPLPRTVPEERDHAALWERAVAGLAPEELAAAQAAGATADRTAAVALLAALTAGDTDAGDTDGGGTDGADPDGGNTDDAEPGGGGDGGE